MSSDLPLVQIHNLFFCVCHRILWQTDETCGSLLRMLLYFNSVTLLRLTHRENLFAGPSEENCAGLGVFAFSDECKVLISNFLDFQQACSCSNIFFSQFLWPADYPGPTGSSD